jgi:hypothetical protein
MTPHARTLLALSLLLSPCAAFAQQGEDEVRRPAPGENSSQCINVEDILSYHTVSDELIRFELKAHDVMARLRKNCPQLHFHGYISYQPVNGMLCAKFDDVVSRSGMPCRIDSFTVLDHKPGDETTDEPADKGN